MVCIPCIVIPLVLWVFHKFIQPWIQPWITKYWKTESQITDALAGPPPSVDPTDKTYLYIQKKISENPVMVFSKKSCSYSAMAKEVLKKIKVEYELEEIDGRSDCSELQAMFQKMTGGRTVPRVFIGGKCVGGGSETYTLHNQNKLVPMCEKAGATFKDKKGN